VPRLSSLDRQLAEVNELLSARRRERAAVEIKYELAALRVQVAMLRHTYVCRKAGFNPNQPRVPAGSREGGQWTDAGGGSGSGSNSGGGTNPDRGTMQRVRLADARDVLNPGVMSDVTSDPIIPGARYAQTQIEIKPNTLIGNPKIDRTTVKLTTTLGHAMDVIEYVPGTTPQEYGQLVHERFADTVRVLGLPGIAYEDVETTFGGSYYGVKGSVRTDVVLRDEANKVIAIYDVKTGNATIGAARAAQLRAKVGVDASVPIFELQILRGVTRKSRQPWLCCGYRNIFCELFQGG
jgi:hypothetical protein